jgi:glycosyltransferase involved in cell wall biosynthesis
MRDIEVIVVLDGPDPATLAALESMNDPRLRIHIRPERGGQPAAINSGVRLARGVWTALLDDDDEWLPEKLETQLRVAESSAISAPVVGCHFWARSDEGDVLWPRRGPRQGEPVGEYLFCRSRLTFGEGVLPTSVLFAPTHLFHSVPMDEDLPRHCDLDWLLRVDARPDVALHMPAQPAPLAIWHLAGHDRMSKAHDWRFSYEWIARCRPIVTPRAYAGFLLTWVSFSARSEGDLRALPILLKEAMRRGRPGARDLAVYAAVWCLPMTVRAQWSTSIAKLMDRGGSE